PGVEHLDPVRGYRDAAWRRQRQRRARHPRPLLSDQRALRDRPAAGDLVPRRRERRREPRRPRHLLSHQLPLRRRAAAAALLSVIAVGEIRRGIERIRRRDMRAARTLEAWLEKLVSEHADRILPVDVQVAEEWGRMNVPDPIPVVHGLMAATAMVSGLTLATR